jgi:enoyl-CoA hydratase
MRTAMQMMLTGDSISGTEAARLGWANAAYPADELDERVLEIAQRIAQVDPDLLQLNKRLVHRGMEVMGFRTAVRIGTELCALGTHTASMAKFVKSIQDQGLTGALSARDDQFGDYRTAESHEPA